jgi:hypothetical protein
MSSEHSFISFTPVLFEEEAMVGRNENTTNIRKGEGDFTKYRENV